MIGCACANLALRPPQRLICCDTVEKEATTAACALAYSSVTSGILSLQMNKAFSLTNHFTHNHGFSLSIFVCISRRPQKDHQGSSITLYLFGRFELGAEGCDKNASLGCIRKRRLPEGRAVAASFRHASTVGMVKGNLRKGPLREHAGASRSLDHTSNRETEACIPSPVMNLESHLGAKLRVGYSEQVSQRGSYDSWDHNCI